MTDQQPNLDTIQARANAATPGPWGTYQYGGDSLIEIAADLEETGCGYSARRTICRFDEEPLDNDPAHRGWMAEEDWAQVQADAAYIAAMSPEVAKALVAEVRRLRADAADALLPAWEAVYEPGNVSDYLIGYANDEDPAKAAAEAWLRSQKDDIGRLEWVPEERLATGRYDRWFELLEHHDDGIPTGPGLIVRRRAAVESHVVADDSDDPEHCGAVHHHYPETVCTEPAGHYRRDVDPHAGPLIVDGRECGGAAWDHPAAPAARSAAV